MLVELLTRVYENLRRTPGYLIGSHRVTCALNDDFCSICNGLVLWCGVLLDLDDWLVLYGQKDDGFRNRIISMPIFSGRCDVVLSDLFTFLDLLDDSLIQQLSADGPFKEGLSFETKAPTQFGVVKGIISAIAEVIHRRPMLVKEGVSLIHQALSMLHKLSIDRPDLKEQAFATFLAFEETQLSRDSLLENPETTAFINDMNKLARIHLKDFKPDPLYPHHGPGAVSTSGIHSKYDKYLSMHTDSRIAYLLAKNDLGTEHDYNP